MRRIFTASLLIFVLGLTGFLPVRAFSASLWSPAELAATPEERKAGRLTAPDLTPPDRTAPLAALAPLPPERRGSIRRVDTGGEKLVALTFDLCELSDQRAGYDGAIVDYLRAEGVPATFFASGKWLRSHPERSMQLLADPLFEVGSHAWTHGNFGVLSPERMREQIAWTQAQYELTREAMVQLAAKRGLPELAAASPASIRVFRFPYGRCRAEALELLAGMGIAAVQWDVNMMDAAKTRTAQTVARDVERGVKPGSIVLGHANGFGYATADALRLIVPALRAKGYRFVTVSALLDAGRAVTAAQCYDSRPGDTDVYDVLFGDGTVHRRNK
ncbi:polysaccharide deacetylase family protein [Fundidesulfovibrio putealis]|uniref:polysaccharide deacetylase family protein n=1 Tax=Fundidesulfovibrio putealis TaxID=270496 RepID=UPI000421DDAC|nr:polysaccharide deacetylase family protein [Fundidesulfovibrio putealis]